MHVPNMNQNHNEKSKALSLTLRKWQYVAGCIVM